MPFRPGPSWRTTPGYLAQAVEAYREALQVYTRDRGPFDWAATQSNLGNALRTLGEREGGTERLRHVNGRRKLMNSRHLSVWSAPTPVFVDLAEGGREWLWARSLRPWGASASTAAALAAGAVFG